MSHTEQWEFFLNSTFHEIRAWIDEGGDVNAKCSESYFGNPPLVVAAINNRLQIAKLLLARGADVNIQNKYKSTSLHLASRLGHFEMVQLLLEHGADTAIRCSSGEYAVDAAKVETIRGLLSKHAASDENRDNTLDSNDDHNDEASTTTPESTSLFVDEASTTTPESMLLYEDEPWLKKSMELAHVKHDYECTMAEMELEIKTNDIDAKRLRLKRKAELKQLKTQIQIHEARLQGQQAQLQAKFQEQRSHLQARLQEQQARLQARLQEEEAQLQTKLREHEAQLQARLQEQQAKLQEQQAKLQAKIALEEAHLEAKSLMLQVKTGAFKRESEKAIQKLQAEVTAGKEDEPIALANTLDSSHRGCQITNIQAIY